MAAPMRSAGSSCPGVLAIALLCAATAACVENAEYARPGESLAPHQDKALVFTRIRFFDGGVEYRPWGAPSLGDALFGVDRERHVWYRALDRDAVSWELHPDTDGSLATWLPAGDYALLGLEGELPPEGAARPEVVALLRVPESQALVYAGELAFTTEHVEGWSARYVFGTSRVTTESVAAATAALEARIGPLPGKPAVSAWCVGDAGRDLPPYYDSRFASRARQFLHAACSARQ